MVYTFSPLVIEVSLVYNLCSPPNGEKHGLVIISQSWVLFGMAEKGCPRTPDPNWAQGQSSDLVNSNPLFEFSFIKQSKIILHNSTNSIILTHSSYTTFRCKPHI